MTEKIVDKSLRNDVKRHDFFNIIVLLFICSLNTFFLSLTTDISLLGTDELASEPFHRFLFKLSLYLFITYVVVDTFWVVLIPSCVLSDPTSILFHHLVTLVMTLVPFVHQQFGWHFGACILVEVNTFFLTLRRNLSRGTVAYAMRYFQSYLLAMPSLPNTELLLFTCNLIQRFAILRIMGDSPSRSISLADTFLHS